ncbi:hypothetical protein Ping_3167 [Psychromonas ingrahamii 37]|uniref:Uncharacterized protein n=1 Tax=Psychromonas ingrahamii (strain DSM 17664 / CCUG 51855 / 37) TaxID=357804 RepID=A1SZE0_PSYIN|nr:hypothetical protein [Psychromonas ingrahamii]ABM04855.1 hypothetical protein Ping_3167 [Psychromonas ingrahamii 37]
MDPKLFTYFTSRAYSKMIAQYLANVGHSSTIPNQCNDQEAEASKRPDKDKSIVSRGLINESVVRQITINQFIDKGQYYDR